MSKLVHAKNRNSWAHEICSVCIHPQLVLKGKLLVGSGGAEDTLDLADKEEQGDEDEDVQDDDAVVLNPYLVLGRASRCGLCSVRYVQALASYVY